MARERLAVGLALLALSFQARADANLPETTLPLRLVGTVVASRAERSIAVVENDGARVVAHVGDAVGSARVTEIRKDGIVLQTASRLEHLPFTLGRADSADAPGVASVAASARDESEARERDAATRDWRRAAQERRARLATKPRATRAANGPASAPDGAEVGETVAAKPVDSQALLAQLANQARYAPYRDEDGNLRGVALMDIRPDSTLERIGLRSGDVVVSIAGVKVDNTPQAFDALRSLNPRAGGEVLVERRGIPTRIAVPPGAL